MLTTLLITGLLLTNAAALFVLRETIEKVRLSAHWQAIAEGNARDALRHRDTAVSVATSMSEENERLRVRLEDAERRARRREAAKREPAPLPNPHVPTGATLTITPVGAGSPGSENAT